MRMRNISIVAALALVITACGSQGMQTETSANGTEAKMIAVVKGCELWRVRDGSMRSVYMTICPGQATGSTEHQENCGKGCTRNVQNSGAIIRD